MRAPESSVAITSSLWAVLLPSSCYTCFWKLSPINPLNANLHLSICFSRKQLETQSARSGPRKQTRKREFGAGLSASLLTTGTLLLQVNRILITPRKYWYFIQTVTSAELMNSAGRPEKVMHGCVKNIPGIWEIPESAYKVRRLFWGVECIEEIRIKKMNQLKQRVIARGAH